MRGQHPGHYIVSYDSELATSFVGLLRVVALLSSREDGNNDVSHSFQSVVRIEKGSADLP